MQDTPLIYSLPAGLKAGYRLSQWNPQRVKLVFEIVDPIELAPGIHLLLSPNGSGKTTLLKTIAGLLPPLAGQLSTQSDIRYYSDELTFDPVMSVQSIFRTLLGAKKLKSALEIADFLSLDTRKPYGHLSRGNRQKVLLTLAEAELSENIPVLLLHDEPLAGLDAQTRNRMAELWNRDNQHHIRLMAIHETECLQRVDSILRIQDEKLVRQLAPKPEQWKNHSQLLQHV